MAARQVRMHATQAGEAHAAAFGETSQRPAVGGFAGAEVLSGGSEQWNRSA